MSARLWRRRGLEMAVLASARKENLVSILYRRWCCEEGPRRKPKMRTVADCTQVIGTSSGMLRSFIHHRHQDGRVSLASCYWLCLFSTHLLSRNRILENPGTYTPTPTWVSSFANLEARHISGTVERRSFGPKPIWWWVVCLRTSHPGYWGIALFPSLCAHAVISTALMALKIGEFPRETCRCCQNLKLMDRIGAWILPGGPYNPWSVSAESSPPTGVVLLKSCTPPAVPASNGSQSNDQDTSAVIVHIKTSLVGYSKAISISRSPDWWGARRGASW